MVVARNGTGTRHVHRYETLDAARLDGIQRRRVAADLFGHGENVEAEARGLRTHMTGIRRDLVQIQHVGIRRNLALLV
jgi:hypothetical protein